MININKLKNNSKIIENYFFMSLFQLVSIGIGFITYPYLIRTLGAESYGLYVFVSSIVMYFFVFVSFGFYFPALKEISKNQENIDIKSKIVSTVFVSRFLLWLISLIIFFILYLFIPFIQRNLLLFLVSFVPILSDILFPLWYYQGVQKMKVVTYIQLSFRALTIPLIFLCIKEYNDVLLYAIIIATSQLVAGVFSMVYLKIKEKLKFTKISVQELKQLFKDGLPFFWTSSTGVIKKESITFILGVFFGMREVALYDLANKILNIPLKLIQNINSALFPKLIQGIDKNIIRKIIKYDFFIGGAIALLLSCTAYVLVYVIGGMEMIDSYPIVIILSFQTVTWLVVGAYIQFVFIPNNKYYFVTINQLWALASFLIFSALGLYVFSSIYVFAFALILSGFCEVVYCLYITRKHSLL